MNDVKLTEAESLYLESLRKLPASMRSRFAGWGAELLPCVGLFAYGFFTDSRLFLALGFASLLYFSAWRMYSQFRGMRLLKGILEKIPVNDQP